MTDLERKIRLLQVTDADNGDALIHRRHLIDLLHDEGTFDLKAIEEQHRQLNGELRVELRAAKENIASIRMNIETEMLHGHDSSLADYIMSITEEQ